jgi:hypothetical protein
MNIYEAHAQGLAEYQAEQVAGVAPSAPGANQTPGTIIYAGNPYPATAGPFVEHQYPREHGGGFTRSLMGWVSINKSDLPAGTMFKTGQYMQVNAPFTAQRNCQVEAIDDCFTSWLVTLMDLSQNA